MKITGTAPYMPTITPVMLAKTAPDKTACAEIIALRLAGVQSNDGRTDSRYAASRKVKPCAAARALPTTTAAVGAGLLALRLWLRALELLALRLRLWALELLTLRLLALELLALRLRLWALELLTLWLRLWALRR